MDQQVKDALVEALKKAHDQLQERPNQYVVAYFRKDNDKLIGYHASTFCQLTDNLLNGKRYAGENPYGQLETIAQNVKYTLDTEKHMGLFASAHNAVKEQFGGLKSNELYMDAVYLDEDAPKQSFKYEILENVAANTSTVQRTENDQK
jgi:hypothetical protein